METRAYDDFIQLEKERCSTVSLCLVVHLAVTDLTIGEVRPPAQIFYLFKPMVLGFA